jgi:hypothetical protein
MKNLAFLTAVIASIPSCVSSDDNPMITSEGGGQITTIPCTKVHKVIMSLDGRSTFEQRTYFDVVQGVSPDDNYALEYCNLYQKPAPLDCPGSYSCTPAGDALPVGDNCTFSYRSATFVGNAMFVGCGTGTTDLTTSQTTESKWVSVRLHRY